MAAPEVEPGPEPAPPGAGDAAADALQGAPDETEPTPATRLALWARIARRTLSNLRAIWPPGPRF